MSKVPSHSSLGKTGPLITDAIGLTHAYVYTRYAHMDTHNYTLMHLHSHTSLWDGTNRQREAWQGFWNRWITLCSYFQVDIACPVIEVNLFRLSFSFNSSQVKQIVCCSFLPLVCRLLTFQTSLCWVQCGRQWLSTYHKTSLKQNLFNCSYLENIIIHLFWYFTDIVSKLL